MAGNKYNSSLKANILDDLKDGILQKDLSIKHKSTISRIVNSNVNIYTVHKGGRPKNLTIFY